MNDKSTAIGYIRTFQVAIKNGGIQGLTSKFAEFKSNINASKCGSLEEYERRVSLLEAAYDFMCSHKLRSEVEQMSMDQIYSIVCEIQLNDNTRKYDMSDLFDENLIGVKGSQRTVVEVNKTGQPITISDSLGRNITITPIGGLMFENGAGLKNNITKYVITKKAAAKDYDVTEVYSEMDFLQLQHNDEYRSLVADELLSDRNIKLSRADGYIGKIESGKSQAISNAHDFVHSLSDNYVLHYDAEELSAVGIVKRDLLKTEEKSLDAEPITEAQLLERYGIILSENNDGDGR